MRQDMNASTSVLVACTDSIIITTIIIIIKFFNKVTKVI